MITREIEAETQPVRTDVAPLVAGLDAGVALAEPVAIADHAEAEGILVDVHGRMALPRPALLGVVQEAGQIQVEALLAFRADLEVDDHVIRHVTLGDVHPDIGDVEILLNAVAETFEHRRVEILAGDLTQLGTQRVAELGAASSGDLDAFDDQPGVHVGGPGICVGRLVREGDAHGWQHHREDPCQQQLTHT